MSPGAVQRSVVSVSIPDPTYPAGVVGVGLDDGTDETIGTSCIDDGVSIPLGSKNGADTLGVGLHANGEHKFVRLGG